MFSGVFSALITPFTPEGEIDEAALRALVDWQAGKGLKGIYVCGNTGQGLLMSVKERMRVHELARDAAADRLQVIAHVCALNTRDTVALARHANEAGLDGISSLAPVYVEYTPDEMVDFYRAIGDNTDLPCLIYVKSGGGAAPMDIPTAVRISKLPRVIGMKYTDMDLFRIQWIVREIGPDWNVLSGPDEMFLPALAMGVHGCIGTTQNLVPEIFLAIHAAFEAGDWARAMELQRLITRLVILYRRFGGLVTAMAVLKIRGVIEACARAPLKPAVPQDSFAEIEQEWRSIVADCPIALD